MFNGHFHFIIPWSSSTKGQSSDRVCGNFLWTHLSETFENVDCDDCTREVLIKIEPSLF